MKNLLNHILTLLNLALALALVTGFHLSSTTTGSESQRQPALIDVAQASKTLESTDVVYIDARPGEIYAQEHIPPALSWPAGTKPTGEVLEAMRNASKVIVYCDGPNCKAAELVANDALFMHFDEVYLMRAGMEGWREKGLPVVRMYQENPQK